ncbi:MAG: glycosyltransferase family 4 protein [Holosporaceae bacterium]|jgi:glycosyltransferase involved in cell wall biosynthesis|nr:glycosyltransferase family 4 protein [Holosporaceae bacterium]
MKKDIRNNIVCIIVFIVVFIVNSLITLILMSDAKFSDFFTTGRISCLENRDANITRDIVVDNTSIRDEGGIKTLAENLIGLMAAKRPHWRFIVLITDGFHDNFSRLRTHRNVKFLHVHTKYSSAFLLLRNIMNFLTLGLFHDKITQLIFYNTICTDDKCDLFFDPYAEFAVNDFSIPKVSLIHDLSYLDLPECWLPKTKQWRKNNSELIIQNSKKIITISNFSRKRIIDLYKVNEDFVEGIPICLARRISNKRPTANFVNSTLKKYDLIKNNYLIYPSSFWGHKNHARLLESFAKFLAASHSKVKLAIVGKFRPWKNHDFFKDTLEKNDLTGKVVFTNFVPDDELDVLLSNSIALVFPSLYEGFGMPIIEAMTAGVPVICSNAGSLPEVAGDAALFFNPTDIGEMVTAISRIVADSKLREDLIQRGYKQAEKFTDTEAMINGYIKVFEEVMDKKN